MTSQSQGDRDRTIVAMVIARAWRDTDYKNRFLQNPKATLAEEGVHFPSGVNVRVLEDTATTKYINLGRGSTDASQVLSLLRRAIPIPEGHELRLVQSTGQTRYLVLPVVPSGVGPRVTSEPELARVAANSSPNVFQDVEVATTEVTVGETTTDVVAEVEVAIVLT